jgi:hypothetical protein
LTGWCDVVICLDVGPECVKPRDRGTFQRMPNVGGTLSRSIFWSGCAAVAHRIRLVERAAHDTKKTAPFRVFDSACVTREQANLASPRARQRAG